MRALSLVLGAGAASVTLSQPSNGQTGLCSFDAGAGLVNPVAPGAISFSACSLANPASVYMYTDPSDAQTFNATYIFNIGNNVNLDPGVPAQAACLAAPKVRRARAPWPTSLLSGARAPSS